MASFLRNPAIFVRAQQRPDHRRSRGSSNATRTRSPGCFGEVLTLCARSGLVQAGVTAVDGTKVHANAARDANLDYGQLAREILEEAKATDAAGLDRFKRRGRGAVRTEWRLITATHNLLKL